MPTYIAPYYITNECACLSGCQAPALPNIDWLYQLSVASPSQDLEIAADFMVQVPARDLLDILQASDHVQVLFRIKTVCVLIIQLFFDRELLK